MAKPNLIRLEAKREKVLTLLAADLKKRVAVQDGLGHGYGMRAYSRLKNLSFRREDELRERLTKVEADLHALGWRAPGPAPVVRSEAEGLRNYCEVMGLPLPPTVPAAAPQPALPGPAAPAGTAAAPH